MGVKLYVGNLSYKTTEEELNAHFATAGSVKSVKLVTDRFSGQSRGFAFVEMASEPEALKAVEDLNGKPLGGRTLVVNEAHSQIGEAGGEGGKPHGGGFRGRGGFGGGGERRGGGGGWRGGRGGDEGGGGRDF